MPSGPHVAAPLSDGDQRTVGEGLRELLRVLQRGSQEGTYVHPPLMQMEASLVLLADMYLPLNANIFTHARTGMAVQTSVRARGGVVDQCGALCQRGCPHATVGVLRACIGRVGHCTAHVPQLDHVR